MIRRSLPVIFWLLALLCEAGAVYCIAGVPRAGWVSAGFLHLVSSLLLICMPALLRLPPERQFLRYSVRLGGWLTLFMPVLGLVGFSLVLLSVKFVLKQKGIVEDYRDTIEYIAGEPLLPGLIQDVDAYMRQELNVEPILDIFRGHDENMKRGAINYLGRLGTPEAVRTLTRCLSDASPDVRLYAHSTLSKLDLAHNRRIQDAKGLIKKEGKKAEHHKALGLVYKNYAESGLLDTDTTNHYMNLAKLSLEQASSLADTDPEIPIILGKLHIATAQFDEAEKCYQEGLKSARQPLDFFLGLCEVYYEKGDMPALAATARQMRDVADKKTGDPRTDALVHFWAKAG